MTSAAPGAAAVDHVPYAARRVLLTDATPIFEGCRDAFGQEFACGASFLLFLEGGRESH
jgi:hypothetical protein